MYPDTASQNQALNPGAIDVLLIGTNFGQETLDRSRNHRRTTFFDIVSRWSWWTRCSVAEVLGGNRRGQRHQRNTK